MTLEEKTKEIEKIWKKKIKGKDNIPEMWKYHPKAFVNWSLRKYQKGFTLQLKNKECKDILFPYNLTWGKPTRGRPHLINRENK